MEEGIGSSLKGHLSRLYWVSATHSLASEACIDVMCPRLVMKDFQLTARVTRKLCNKSLSVAILFMAFHRVRPGRASPTYHPGFIDWQQFPWRTTWQCSQLPNYTILFLKPIIKE